MKKHLKQKHPHACGEDTHTAIYLKGAQETPPRVWGRRDCCVRYGLHAGNTPTRVGKTRRRAALQAFQRKHPHACGEDFYTSLFFLPALETPPRVWGRHQAFSCLLACLRNTPTRVGKTLRAHAIRTHTQKHPHACGEDCVSDGGKVDAVETPPRVWGRRNSSVTDSAHPGNTPTRVGKTLGISGGSGGK